MVIRNTKTFKDTVRKYAKITRKGESLSAFMMQIHRKWFIENRKVRDNES